MNVITFEAAYCLFPRATLQEHMTLVSSPTKGIYHNRDEALRKYRERNFTIAFSVPTDDFARKKPLFPLGWRWIDDQTSWVIRFSLSGIRSYLTDSPLSVSTVHDPVVITNWHMRCNSRRGGGVVMLLGIIKSEFLQHRYLITDQDLVAYIAQFLALKCHNIDDTTQKRGQSTL